eukprot:jgi/Galph1/3407/GphlegSOOS_G2083.1
MNFPGCRTSEEGLDTLYNGTLYVYLELGRFPKEGHRFEYVLHQKICETALSGFPNGSQLLSEVLPLVPQGPFEWLAKTLSKEDYFQFKDLKSPSPSQSASNVYRLFFRLLRPLLVEPFVLCILAGRSDAIVRRQEDAMPSRVSLRFLLLDTFSSDIVNDIVQQSTYREEPLQKTVFPKTPQRIDWLSEIVWEYTGGVPIYVHYILAELAKRCVSNPEWQDLSKKELREKKASPCTSIVTKVYHLSRLEAC